MARIAVGLSGGVDSAVAAARLVEAGYEVVGLTAKLLPPDWPLPGGCCQEELAAALCQRLGLEHHLVELGQDFADVVIDYFVRGYAAGLTPNPCLPCNRLIKFGALLAAARRLGCEALATGHYALRARRGERWGIRRGRDRRKEQSYMLLGLSQDQLACALFPLGESHKAAVVAEAQRRGLPALLRESQDVCFVGEDYGAFLARFLDPQPGPIVDVSGQQLGTHRGLIYYTVGQRRGLRIGGGRRLYVLAKDPTRNALVVGPREMLCRQKFEVEQVNWVSLPPPAPGEEIRCQIMVRYRGELLPGSVTVLSPQRCQVRVGPHQQAIAPGQGAAFYDDEGWLLGGGYIAPAPGLEAPAGPSSPDQSTPGAEG
jgi:tRNA-specific 2-thiouridylase